MKAESNKKRDYLADAKKGKWVPFKKIKPRGDFDWVLVQFVEKKTGFVGIPCIACLSNIPSQPDRWVILHATMQTNNHYNNECYASSWKIINKSPEFKASEKAKK